jgi:biopolymer transport protein ExbB/TolQ
METVVRMLVSSGAFLYATAGVLAVGLALVVERSWSIFFRYNVNSKAFMGQIEKLMEADNLERASKLCAAAGDAALPRVVRAGLARVAEGPAAAKDAMDEIAAEVTPLLVKRLGMLGGLAAIAAALGLVGAGLGVHQALGSFDAISLVQGLSLFLRRASMSVVTVAFGLGAAAILGAARVILAAVSARISGEIALQTIRLRALLAKRGAGHPAD